MGVISLVTRVQLVLLPAKYDDLSGAPCVVECVEAAGEGTHERDRRGEGDGKERGSMRGQTMLVIFQAWRARGRAVGDSPSDAEARRSRRRPRSNFAVTHDSMVSSR
jgi:hypothetical protein